MTRKMRRKSFDDVFDQMQNLFEEFQDVGKDLAGFTGMPIDVQEEDGEIVVKADMPGLSKEDINLKADEDSLEISAESEHEYREENEKYFKKERSTRSFRREVRWPSTINPETIHAEYSDGVLTVRAEKEEEEGRNIEIE